MSFPSRPRIRSAAVAIAAFVCAVAGRAASAADPGESRFLSRVRQLTFEGARAGEGYFSPDGDRIVFQSEREAGNPFYQIYVLNLITGETKRVSTGTGKTTCAYFRPPAGDRLLFSSTHLDPDSAALQQAELDFRASGQERRYSWDYDANMDIFETDVRGRHPKRLTDAEGYDAEASYSPDGSLIAFCSTRSAYPLSALSPEDAKRAEVDLAYFGEIYIMNSDGTDVRRLTETPGYDGGPFFSPDGKRIVWRRFDEHGVIADIHTMALDGSDKRRITDFAAMSWAPFFHPSGEYLIFASNKLGFANFECYLADAAGEKEPVRVTFTEGFDGLPVFSPDGKRLCWTSNRAGGKGGQLYMGQWNHEAALAALAAAPPRVPSKSAAADFVPEIAEADVRVMVDRLASEEFAGRLTGTDGERLAGDYIAERFQAIGLEPVAGLDGFFQPFDFASGVDPGPDNALALLETEANPHIPADERAAAAKPKATFEAGKDFLPLAFSDSGTTEGLVAFAGYGLYVPGEGGADKPRYDSYGDLDVEGRIVVAFRYVPEAVSAEERQVLNRYAGLRFKALHARELGARGMIVVTGPNSADEDALVGLDFDIGGSVEDFFAVSATRAAAEKILASGGKSLKELQDALDDGTQTETFALEDTLARLRTDVVVRRGEGRNVLAVLPPTGGVKPDTEYVAVGAHYDHLGLGGGGRTLARKGEEGMIHYGADDNASGVAAILEVAQSLAASPEPRSRATLFAAWSGEEMGLLGSAHFVRTRTPDPAKIVAYLNLDMVGRVKDDKLTIQAVGSAPEWRGIIERKNVPAGFALTLSDDPYLPTDATSFYTANVPTLHFFSGAHEDYHRPTDTADKVNVEGVARVAEMVASIARDYVGGVPAPTYARVERKRAPEGSRETLRAYIGTIPDYASEGVKGVKLSGVRAGGPADKAGLKGEDVIVEFGGKAIGDIYEFTYALDAVKVGEPVKVVVERGGERVEVVVVPERRD